MEFHDRSRGSLKIIKRRAQWPCRIVNRCGHNFQPFTNCPFPHRGRLAETLGFPCFVSSFLFLCVILESAKVTSPEKKVS